MPEPLQDGLGQLREGGIPRAHDQHQVPGLRLGGQRFHEAFPGGREKGLGARGLDLANDFRRGDVPGHRAPGIEDVQHPEPVLGPQAGGESLDELPAQEAQGAVTMGLEHRQHPATPVPGRAQGGGYLGGVVAEIVHHLHAPGRAHALEAARHAQESRQGRGHGLQRHTQTAAARHGGQGVLHVVDPGHGKPEPDTPHREGTAAGILLHILAPQGGAGPAPNTRAPGRARPGSARRPRRSSLEPGP